MERRGKIAILAKKPGPRPSETAFTAACNVLLTGKSTREENRVAVRLLLRRASKNLERSR